LTERESLWSDFSNRSPGAGRDLLNRATARAAGPLDC
jgi:hypothetical protein